MWKNQQTGERSIVPRIRLLRVPSSFSLRLLLLLFIPLSLTAWFTRWLLYVPPLDIQVSVEPYSFVRYDDGAGHLPLGAIVTFTNFSESPAWYYGFSRSPACQYRECIGGQWTSHTSWWADDGPRPEEHWAAMRPQESVTIVAGPISESASEMCAGVLFTSGKLATTKAQWVFSPTTKIVKRADCFFPETTPPQ